MNKSYSKLRNIQEANRRLELRLIVEDDQAQKNLDMVNNVLQSVGLGSQESVESLVDMIQPDCPPEIEFPGNEEEVKKEVARLESLPTDQLIQYIKDSASKSKTVEEQLIPGLMAVLSTPLGLLGGGLLIGGAFLGLYVLIRRLFSGYYRDRSSCGKRFKRNR